jgi:hypothetical protein
MDGRKGPRLLRVRPFRRVAVSKGHKKRDIEAGFLAFKDGMLGQLC